MGNWFSGWFGSETTAVSPTEKFNENITVDHIKNSTIKIQEVHELTQNLHVQFKDIKIAMEIGIVAIIIIVLVVLVAYVAKKVISKIIQVKKNKKQNKQINEEKKFETRLQQAMASFRAKLKSENDTNTTIV